MDILCNTLPFLKAQSLPEDFYMLPEASVGFR